jgi:hypothetical protein
MAKAQTIVKLTAETNDYEKKMRAANKSFGDFMKGIGMSPAKFNMVAVAVGAMTTALKVAKDAFKQNESSVDEWGRTVEATKSVYNSFLHAINNGDFSGFISGINNVISKAKEAYNALDELNTRMTIINPERAKLQARQTELRATIRRSGADSAAGKAAQQELTSLEPKLEAAFRTESKLNRNAFEALVKQKLADANIVLDKSSYDFLMRTFSSDADFMRMKQNARGSLRTEFRNYKNNGTNTLVSGGYTQKVDDRNINQKLLDLFTDEWRNANSNYLTAAFNAQGAAASTLLGNARYLNGGRGGAGGGGARGGRGGGGGGAGTVAEITYAADSIAAQEALVSELTKKWKEAGAADREDRLKQLNEAQWKLNDMKNPQSRPMLAAPTDIMSALAGKGVEEKVTVPQEALDKIAEEVAKAMAGPEGTPLNEVMGNMASGMSQVVNGMEQLGIDIPDGIKSAIGAIQGISTILTGIATTLIAIETLSAADTLIPFARGGIIPRAAGGYFVGGRNFSSDITPIMANAGELVLNRAQQGVLAQQLSNNHLSNMHLSASLTGETITLAVNAHNRRVGRGEVATTRNRRYGNMDS